MGGPARRFQQKPLLRWIIQCFRTPPSATCHPAERTRPPLRREPRPARAAPASGRSVRVPPPRKISVPSTDVIENDCRCRRRCRTLAAQSAARRGVPFARVPGCLGARFREFDLFIGRTGRLEPHTRRRSEQHFKGGVTATTTKYSRAHQHATNFTRHTAGSNYKNLRAEPPARALETRPPRRRETPDQTRPGHVSDCPPYFARRNQARRRAGRLAGGMVRYARAATRIGRELLARGRHSSARASRSRSW